MDGIFYYFIHSLFHSDGQISISAVYGTPIDVRTYEEVASRTPSRRLLADGVANALRHVTKILKYPFQKFGMDVCGSTELGRISFRI